MPRFSPRRFFLFSAVLHLSLLLWAIVPIRLKPPPEPTPLMVDLHSSFMRREKAGGSSVKRKGSIGKRASLAVSDFSWLRSEGPSAYANAKKQLLDFEDRGTVALDPQSDRQISDYSRLRNKIDNTLYYPPWMRGKHIEGEVIAAIVFSSPPDGKFRIQIRAESSYLRVEVVRLFRLLIQEDLGSVLGGLQARPIYLHFLFCAEKPTEVSIVRQIHNNRLFFRRGFENRPWITQLKQNPKTMKKSVEINVLGFLNKFTGPADSSLDEEEYRMDPAFLDTQPTLEGEIPS